MHSIPQDLADQLAHRIMRRTHVDRNGCWIRTVNVNPATGYTYISKAINGVRTYYLAHRVVFVHYKGQIPDGLTIDHECNVRACVNPDHLRAMPLRENILRSERNPFAINARKVTCGAGHELQAVAVGKRGCAVCRRERSAARRKRKIAEGLPKGDKRHGTSRGYGFFSCRCDPCRGWQKAYHLNRKKASA